MAVTDDQYQRILNRLTNIENMLNDMVIAQSKYVTLMQVNQLLTLLQTDLTDVRENVDELEARVTSIEEEPIS